MFDSTHSLNLMQFFDFENICINYLLIVEWNNADVIIGCVVTIIILFGGGDGGVINTYLPKNIMIPGWFTAEFCPLVVESHRSVEVPPLVSSSRRSMYSVEAQHTVVHAIPPPCASS